MNEWRAQIDLTLAMLCREFPRCFVMFEQKRRPLKVGIFDDIVAALGGQVDRRRLGPALRHYTRNTFYRLSQQPGAPRIDLDGNESGTVSEADAANAAKDVAARKAALAQRKPLAVHKPPSEPEQIGSPPIPELVPPPAPEAAKRLSLADLRAAAQRRKVAAA